MVFVFLAFAALGIAFLSPTVNFGDSGEFIASAATLAIPHAPGYPFFCLLGRALGGLLPWATWAYRVNLASALCAAAAAALLWDALLLIGFSRLASLLGVLFLGLSPLWLHTSLQAEVFALNGLCSISAFWILCRWRERAFFPRAMAALGLCLGLGGGNHHALVFVVPALLFEAWFLARPAPKDLLRGLAYLAFFGALGLVVYFYLPIRARAYPPLDWGHPTGWESFLHVLLRKDYGSFALTVQGASQGRILSAWPQALRYLRVFYAGFGPVGAALALLGLAAWPRSGAAITWRFPVFWVLLAGPVFLWLGNPPFDPLTSGALERFYLLSWIGAAGLVACGGAVLERIWRPAAYALLLAPIFSAARSTPAWSQRWDLAAYDYGCNVLRSLPPNSLLYIDGGDDTFYTLAYLQYAQGRRTDVEVHDRGGLVFRNPYGADFRLLSKEDKEERRLRVESSAAGLRETFYSTLRDRILPDKELVPWGLLRRAVPRGGKPPDGSLALWAVYPRRASASLARAHYRYRSLMPFYDVMRAAEDAARGRDQEALTRLRLAALDGPDALWIPEAVSARAQWVGYSASQRQDWTESGEAYRLGLEMQPDNAQIWSNFGVTLEKQRRFQEAESAYLRALSLSGSFEAYHNLGALYWLLGRWDKATEMFGQAVRLRPEDRAARSFFEAAAARAGKRQ